MSLDTLKKKALQDDRVKTEYEKLTPEFRLIDQLLSVTYVYVAREHPVPGSDLPPRFR